MVQNMKTRHIVTMLLAGVFCVLISSLANAEEMSSLLANGKQCLENNQYEKAVEYLGKILDASGNQSSDPKVISFGATVQAYGLIRLNDPNNASTIKHHLDKAIKADPAWQFPQKLLKDLKDKT